MASNHGERPLRRKDDWPTLPEAGEDPADKYKGQRLGDIVADVYDAQRMAPQFEPLTESHLSNPHNMRSAALKTLEALGYTWQGWERWKPPIGAHDPNRLLQNVGGTEKRVCIDIARRQAHGLAKYGVTVAANPLELRAWVQHAYEEAMDLAVYLRRILDELDKSKGS